MQTEYLVYIPLALQMAGLVFAVSSDSYISKKHRRVMDIIIICTLILLLQNFAGYKLETLGTNPYARTVAGIVGYTVRPLIIMLFFYIVSSKKQVAAWMLIAVNTAVHLTALFSGVCFSIDEMNHFHRGPLGFTCHIVSTVMLLWLFILTVREYGKRGIKAIIMPVFNVLLIIAAVILDTFIDTGHLPASYLTMAVVISVLFYYIWLHLQFVHEHEEAMRAEQRIQIMITQIQPHFLYNTLATIQSLCRIDSEKAAIVTEKFGTYLRDNLDSLQQRDLIPVRKEIEHTRIYSEIEAIRFPGIHVEYDIGDEDFSLPALTIQPLVENAIRHGVRGVKDGHVTVCTRKRGYCHEVAVTDNGRGFDPKKLNRSDNNGKTKHIGIQNVRERLEEMCGGTLDIESGESGGTSVIIRIPV